MFLFFSSIYPKLGKKQHLHGVDILWISKTLGCDG